MRNKIIELSESLTNMIAAGEVIERPSSVVKELVENSVDASSTKIKIDLVESGIRKITVTDNGIGMSKEEIPFAIKRHATSKISTIQDLFSITSLGFRGEALPSIASVSNLTISSCTDNVHGYMYQYRAGVVQKDGPCSLPQGTKIEVENIFFNTPARFKHLGNAYQEIAHIMNYCEKMAIAHPNVSFTVNNNGRNLLQTLGSGSVMPIIATVYGTEVAKNMIPFSSYNALYHIDGFCSNNSTFRSNKNNITIIINNRVIKNPVLIYAITDSYKTILPIGKYPIVILNIKCDYQLVDVNVHPMKLEIRFTDELELRKLITNTISEKLLETDLIVESTMNEPIRQNVTPFTAVETKNSADLSIDSFWERFELATDNKTTYQMIPSENQVIEETISIESIANATHEQIQLSESTNFFSQLSYLGSYNKTYLLMENNNDLYLIDQHAAMERYMYEKISDSFKEPTNEFFELLIPIKMDYSLSEVPNIINISDELIRLGITIEHFGSTSIIVRTIPTWIPEASSLEFISDIIQQLIAGSKVDRSVLYDNLAKKLSCKKSIKAHMSITELEVSALMTKLDECKMPYTCPHGRPTLIKFSLYEIEKLFKRVM